MRIYNRSFRAEDVSGSAVAGAQVTLWDSKTGGTQITTGIQDLSGVPIPGGLLTCDGWGYTPDFQDTMDRADIWAIGSPTGTITGVERVLLESSSDDGRIASLETYTQGPGGLSERLTSVESGLGAVVEASVNVVAYGAVGDGATDDTAAIQAAIDDLPSGGGTVYFPSGTYFRNGTLTVRPRLGMVGAGDGSSVLYCSNTSASGLVGVDIDRLTIENLKLFGPGSGTGTGISLTRSANAATTYCVFRNVYVASWGGDGIAISNPIVSTFSRVISETNGGHGFNLYGVTGGAAGTSSKFDSCYGNGNGQAGFRLFNMIYCALSACAADSNGIGYLIDSCQGISLSSCGAESCVNRSAGYPGTGFKVSGGFGISLLSCWIFDNPQVGVYVTGTAHTVTLGGLTDNTPHAGAVNFIKVDTGSGVTMWACSNTTANSLAGGTTQILDDGGGGMSLRAFLYGASTAAFEQDITSYGGDLIANLAGKGLRVKEGTNARMGTATLAAGTVTVSTTAVTANSRIFLTHQTPGAAPGALRVDSRTAGTSFVVKSANAGDTGTFAWMIVEPS